MIDTLGSLYETADLRKNDLTQIDTAKLRTFKYINLMDNPHLDCDHLTKQEDFKMLSVSSHCDYLLSTSTSQHHKLSIVKPTKVAEQIDEMSTKLIEYGAGLLGSANVHGSGQLNLKWGYSITMTVFAVISGVVTLYGFLKIKGQISKVWKYVRRNEVYGYEIPDDARRGETDQETGRKTLCERLTGLPCSTFRCTEKQPLRTPAYKKGRNGKSRRKQSHPRAVRALRGDARGSLGMAVLVPQRPLPPPPSPPPMTAAVHTLPSSEELSSAIDTQSVTSHAVSDTPSTQDSSTDTSDLQLYANIPLKSEEESSK